METTEIINAHLTFGEKSLDDSQRCWENVQWIYEAKKGGDLLDDAGPITCKTIKQTRCFAERLSTME